MGDLKRRAKGAQQTAETTTAPAEPAVPETPAAPEAPRQLMARKIDPALLRAAVAANKQARGSKTPFIKLTAGNNRVRLLGPRDPEKNPLPFFFHRVHTWKAKYNEEAVDLDFLFSNPELTELAIRLGKVTQADFAKWQQYGSDPWNIAGERAKDMGLTGKNSSFPYLFSRGKFAYNVIDRADGSVRLWVVGKQTHELILGFYEGQVDEETGEVEGYDLFSEESGHDLRVNGNGENNLKRRYTITPAPKPTPAGEFDPADMTDLEAYVARRARGWDQKVLALFNPGYAKSLKVLGLTPRDFGVQVDSLPSLPEGEDENEGQED